MDGESGPRRHTVLIVDDARIIRSMLKAIFVKLDLVVLAEAANGAEGVELYEKLHPDLVTMDITMPVLDGLSAARAIRTKDPDSNVVMVTSVGQESVMREAIAMGVRDFITKPFDEKRIVSTVRRIFGLAEPAPHP